MIKPGRRQATGGQIGITNRLDLFYTMSIGGFVEDIYQFVQKADHVGGRKIALQLVHATDNRVDDRNVLERIRDDQLAAGKAVCGRIRQNVSQ